jgi:hypothetical protein
MIKNKTTIAGNKGQLHELKALFIYSNLSLNRAININNKRGAYINRIR